MSDSSLDKLIEALSKEAGILSGRISLISNATL